MKINMYLQRSIIALLFLTLLTPFIVIESLFFPFITSKAFYFRVIIELAFALWLILIIRDRSYLPQVKSNSLFWSISFFMVIVFLANIFGVNREESFFSNYERMDGYILLAHLYAYFIVLISIFKDSKIWRWFLKLNVVASVIMSFYGFLQLSGKITINQGGVRLDGTLGNATYLAVYMLFAIFTTIYLAATSEALKRAGSDFWQKYSSTIFYGIALLLQLIILYNTATRGAIIGLVAGLILTSVFIVSAKMFGKESKEQSESQVEGQSKGLAFKISLGALIILIVGVVSFIGLKNTSLVQDSPVLSRFASISLNDKTTLSRFVIWGIAFEGFKERPVLGWGQGNFNLIFDKYYDPVLYNQEQWFDRAHNIIMDWLVNAGVIGLLSYLSIFFFVFWIIWKKTDFSLIEKSLLSGIFVAYFIQNLFVFDNLISYILFFSFLAFVNVHSKESLKNLDHNFDQKDLGFGGSESLQSMGIEKGDSDSASSDNENIKLVLQILVVIVFVFSSYQLNAPSYKSAQELVQGLRVTSVNAATGQTQLYYSEGIVRNYEYFDKALSRDHFGKSEINLQLLLLASRIVRFTGVDEAVQQKFVDRVSDEMVKEIAKNPNDSRFTFQLGRFAAQLGDYEAARNLLEETVSLSPNKPIVRYPLVMVYRSIGEKDLALNLARETYLLETANTDAWILYAQTALQTGNRDLYLSLLAEAKQSNPQRIIDLAKKNIDIDNTNPQAYVSLAAAYRDTGDIQKAIEVLEQTKIDFPDIAPQLDALIAELKKGN